MPCWLPLTTITLSAVAGMPWRRRSAASHSRRGRNPSVMPYCKAAPGFFRSTAW
jgi:hypothetical protein